MDFQPKYLIFEMVLKSIYVYWYHSPQRNSTKNSTNNLSFEIYMQIFQTLWWVLFGHKYILCVQVLQYLLDFLKELTSLTLRLIIYT